MMSAGPKELEGFFREVSRLQKEDDRTAICRWSAAETN
jgi:hypothetical protein